MSNIDWSQFVSAEMKMAVQATQLRAEAVDGIVRRSEEADYEIVPLLQRLLIH